MTTFGKKTRSEWTAQDNAANAVGVMLGAEMRAKTDAERARFRMT